MEDDPLTWRQSISNYQRSLSSNKSSSSLHTTESTVYVSIRYTERLAAAGIEPSVSSVGGSYDNALAETIIGLFKTGHPLSGSLASPRAGRVRHPRVGGLVQHKEIARAHQQHPVGRV